MLAVPLGFEPALSGYDKDLRRFQEELRMEGELQEQLRTERMFRGRAVPPTDPLRRRSSSFMEVPILERRRRSNDEGNDKRLRHGMEVFTPFQIPDENPRKQRLFLVEEWRNT